jgi:hypothetical protein
MGRRLPAITLPPCDIAYMVAPARGNDRIGLDHCGSRQALADDGEARRGESRMLSTAGRRAARSRREAEAILARSDEG